MVKKSKTDGVLAPDAVAQDENSTYTNVGAPTVAQPDAPPSLGTPADHGYKGEPWAADPAIVAETERIIAEHGDRAMKRARAARTNGAVAGAPIKPRSVFLVVGMDEDGDDQDFLSKHKTVRRAREWCAANKALIRRHYGKVKIYRAREATQ